MSLVRVKVAERDGRRRRCAYCHGDLEGEVARCERCHVELHADCRATLGRCPTLGCAERPRRSWVEEPLGSSWVDQANRFTRAARPWPRWLALAELYFFSTGAILGYGTLTLLLGAVVGAMAAGAVALTLNAAGRPGVDTGAVFAILGLLLLAASLAAFFVFMARRTLRIARGAWRAAALLGSRPFERTLLGMESLRDGRTGTVRSFFLEAASAQDELAPWVPLDPAYLFTPRWSSPGRSNVLVYGLAREDEPLVLESERGRLAIAFRLSSTETRRR